MKVKNLPLNRKLAVACDRAMRRLVDAEREVRMAKLALTKLVVDDNGNVNDGKVVSFIDMAMHWLRQARNWDWR
jgi:hypothetical protein